MYLPRLILSLLVVATCVSAASADDTNSPAQTARGVVYLDQNGNERRDANEPGLSGIRVSNGEQIVATNARGEYQLPVTDDTVLFVIKPRGYRTPITPQMLPRFYYNHKPQGSPTLKFPGVAPTGPLPKSVDFPLYRQEEPKQFKAVMFGDPQPRNQREVDYIGHDVVEELVGTDASFGVTLGDIVFDGLDLFESQAATIGLIGIPWYNVIGNHDINLDAKSDRTSDETFERNFGPAYYSFDYGTVHFLVLDDIEWVVSEERGKGSYRGGLGARQMQFIKNDLAMIPEDQLVVLMMHIPLTDVRDRKELYRLIEKRPFCMSISGHTHHHEHRYIKKQDGWMGAQPHHHVINVTVSGSWWSGAPDERGIPHTIMADGAPNGYSIISFDGQQYRVDFRAAGRAPDYQMSIDAPELVSQAALAEATVYANVFNGSERSRVEIQFGKGSPWVAMQHTKELDPYVKRINEMEAQAKSLAWLKLTGAKASTHLWKVNLPAKLPQGTHLLTVRATDPQGKVVQGRRVIRIGK